MAALIEPHIPALRRFAWALLRDGTVADDLVQDCLERAIAGWHLRHHDGNLKAWLFAILHNLFLSNRRRSARGGMDRSLDDDGAAALMRADPTATLAAEGRLVWQDALTALEALPENQRAVILLVGIEDLSYEETARLTGVPIGTVMSRLSRGRERLRRLLDGEVVKAGAQQALRRVK